jgi:hypothetical protein
LLALLELAKRGKIRIFQDQTFGAIRIILRTVAEQRGLVDEEVEYMGAEGLPPPKRTRRPPEQQTTPRQPRPAKRSTAPKKPGK